MIKVGILGADNLKAGELIRILIHHPEVEITTLYSPENAGRKASSIHHGLIGEEIVNFSDQIDFLSLDIIFIANDRIPLKTIMEEVDKNEENKAKIIDLSESKIDALLVEQLSTGLSEINRKELVRGADRARVLPSAVVLTLIALYPFAANLLLPRTINIDVAAPKDIIDSFDYNEVAFNIKRELHKVQKSFDGQLDLKAIANKSERVMRIKISFKSRIEIGEILKLYESIYDDHNFVFFSLSEADGREMEGTHKTLVQISKPDPDECRLEIIGDCRLRGGAGDAVHIMNLFFALYEKIGLTFKPSSYGQNEESASRPAGW